jgi:hypothetical protein
MAKDRSRDDRRSVGSHEKMTAALGRAAGWKRSAGLAMDLGNKEYFSPGHGHVAVGTQSAISPDRISKVMSTSKSATKGLSNG